MNRYGNVDEVLADLALLSLPAQRLPSTCLPSVASWVQQEGFRRVTLSFSNCSSDEKVLDILAAAARAHAATGTRVFLDFDNCSFGR